MGSWCDRHRNDPPVAGPASPRPPAPGPTCGLPPRGPPHLQRLPPTARTPIPPLGVSPPCGAFATTPPEPPFVSPLGVYVSRSLRAASAKRKHRGEADRNEGRGAHEHFREQSLECSSFCDPRSSFPRVH